MAASASAVAVLGRSAQAAASASSPAPSARTAPVETRSPAAEIAATVAAGERTLAAPAKARTPAAVRNAGSSAVKISPARAPPEPRPLAVARAAPQPDRHMAMDSRRMIARGPRDRDPNQAGGVKAKAVVAATPAEPLCADVDARASPPRARTNADAPAAASAAASMLPVQAEVPGHLFVRLAFAAPTLAPRGPAASNLPDAGPRYPGASSLSNPRTEPRSRRESGGRCRGPYLRARPGRPPTPARSLPPPRTQGREESTGTAIRSRSVSAPPSTRRCSPRQRGRAASPGACFADVYDPRPPDRIGQRPMATGRNPIELALALAAAALVPRGAGGSR